MKRTFLALALACAPTVAMAADELKIGVITTLSGPQAALGKDLVDGMKLALKHKGNKVGGREVALTIGDDQLKPDVAQQQFDRMLEKDKIDLLAGLTFSNVLLAVAPRAFEAGMPVLGMNAGPSQVAGAQCNKLFFTSSWSNDNSDEATAQYMNQAGIKKVVTLAPNYPAGKDKINGFKRFFKGELLAEIYTPLNQLDFAGELAQIRQTQPEAVFIFYPGGLGVNFIKQFKGAGLTIPLYGDMNSFDQTILPGVGDAAVGGKSAVFWSERMKSPQNDKFVADFEADYGRIPSPYAAQAYDGIQLLDAALTATKGSVKDKDAFRKAMLEAKFPALRGNFKLGNNGFPAQDWYLGEVVLDSKGRPVVEPKQKIVEGMRTSYDAECKL